MTGPVFVDTNVLFYARDASELVKQPLAMKWLARLWRERTGRLSWQVLNEFYVNVTRKLSPAMSPAAARVHVEMLTAWDPVPVDGKVIRAAWRLQDAYSLSWWDALIVAAAQVAGCAYLLTEDLSAGTKYGGVEVVNPFAVCPEEKIV
jgi:predicted nucleic acid-binding protein